MPNRFLVRLRGDAQPDRVFRGAGPVAAVRALGHRNLHVVEVHEGGAAAIEALAARPDVEFVEPDRIRRATLAAPNDQRFASEWALAAVEALSAWNLVPGRYAAGMVPSARRLKIAVLDSGADCTHPDFRNAGGSSADSAHGGQILFSASQALLPTTVASPACEWQDDFGHGTHVAGTIAAAANNGEGIAGLAYPAQIVIYKVLDETGRGPDSAIAKAIMQAADAGAAVISMSLGEVGYSQTLQDAIDYAWERNSLVIAAAGNDSKDELFFPAAANHVVAVAAVGSDLQRAGFSNYGTFVKVAAPGVGILSTFPTYPVQGLKNYAYYSGTSMATPHVSAVAGLVGMATPELAADAIALRIQQSAVAAGTEWEPELGYGVLNAARALSGHFQPLASGGISGQVLDASGQPVRGAEVWTEDASAISVEGGLYRIWNEAAGAHVLNVAATGYAQQQYTVVVPPGGDAPLTVMLGARLGTLSGTVTSNGTPLAGAVVAALSHGLVRATAVTDEAGRYWLSVPAGVYDLKASAIGHEPVHLTRQDVRAGSVTQASLSASSMGWIEGRLLDARGRPVVNAQIAVTGSGTGNGAVTGSGGHFSTLGLPGGRYTLSVALGDDSAQLGGVQVSPGSGTSVTLWLRQAAAAAPGRPGRPIRLPLDPVIRVGR